MHQMYNLDEAQTELNILVADMCDNLIRTTSEGAIVDHLNLKEVRMASPYFCL